MMIQNTETVLLHVSYSWTKTEARNQSEANVPVIFGLHIHQSKLIQPQMVALAHKGSDHAVPTSSHALQIHSGMESDFAAFAVL